MYIISPWIKILVRMVLDLFPMGPVQFGGPAECHGRGSIWFFFRNMVSCSCLGTTVARARRYADHI